MEEKTVWVERGETTRHLGFSIKGGSESGIPIIIAKTFQGEANWSEPLDIGLEILKVNGQSLRGLTHAEAARILATAGSRLELRVRPNFLLKRALELEQQQQQQHVDTQPRPTVGVAATDAPASRTAPADMLSLAAELDAAMGNEGADATEPAPQPPVTRRYESAEPTLPSPSAASASVASSSSSPRRRLAPPASLTEAIGSTSVFSHAPPTTTASPPESPGAASASSLTSSAAPSSPPRRSSAGSTASGSGASVQPIQRARHTRQLPPVPPTARSITSPSSAFSAPTTAASSDTSSVGRRDSDASQLSLEPPSPLRPPSIPPSEASSSSLASLDSSSSDALRSRLSSDRSRWRKEADADRRRDLERRRSNRSTAAATSLANGAAPAATAFAAPLMTASASTTNGHHLHHHHHHHAYGANVGPATIIPSAAPEHMPSGAVVALESSEPISTALVQYSPGRSAANGHAAARSSRPSNAHLPDGWVERRDPKTGRIFYANLKTRKTSWLDPRITPNGPPKDLDYVDWNALPYGWQQSQDNYGEIFYINHLDKTTAWDPPRLVEQKKQLTVVKERLANQRLLLKEKEGMLQALRRDISMRQGEIEALSKRKIALGSAVRDEGSSEAARARAEGQLEMIIEQIGSEVAKVMETSKAAEAADAVVGESSKQIRALETLLREVRPAASSNSDAALAQAALVEDAELGEQLAHELDKLLTKLTRQFLEARSLLLDVEVLRHKIVGELGEGVRFHQVVDAESLAPLGGEMPQPHISESNQLKTNLELRLDVALVGNVLLPQITKVIRALQDLRARARDLQMASAPETVVPPGPAPRLSSSRSKAAAAAAAASNPATTSSSNPSPDGRTTPRQPLLPRPLLVILAQELGDSALTDFVVTLTDCAMPVAFADKLDRFLSPGSTEGASAPSTRF